MKSIENNIFINHSVNDIDDINDKNVFVSHFVNHFVNDFANDFVNTKVNTKSRHDNDNRTKSIENKSVVLYGVYLQPFWGYLNPFCSTFLTFFTLFLILI